MTNITLKKMPEETETQFVYRLASAREDGLLDMTWDELADVFNRELGKKQCSSAYRKPYQNAQRYRDEVFNAEDDAAVLAKIREEKQELYKARVLLRDERNEFNRRLRDDARRENFLENLIEAMVDDQPIIIDTCTVTDVEETEIIVCLSDLHTGLVACNSANIYDPDILHDRLAQYANEICAIQERHHAKRCVIALMGDQISGNIHRALIAQNSANTVRQLMTACTEIKQFVKALTAYFPQIDIYSISGNHSRVSEKKEDNLPGDNLDSMIPFYLAAAFEGVDRVHVNMDLDSLGEYVRVFTVCGWRFVILHGDLDTPDKATYNMTKLLGYVPDAILMGHMHHSGLFTEGKTRVIQSGCISGTDDYAYNKRLFAPPEQSVIVVTDRKPVECLYNIEFT